MDIPPLPPGPQPNVPQISSVSTSTSAGGEVTVTLVGRNFIDPTSPSVGGNTLGDELAESRVGFVMPGHTEYVNGASYVSASSVDLGGGVFESTITLKVPPTVLLGLSKIVVERPAYNIATGSTQWFVANSPVLTTPVVILASSAVTAAVTATTST